jgi:hypothetical protein
MGPENCLMSCPNLATKPLTPACTSNGREDWFGFDPLTRFFREFDETKSSSREDSSEASTPCKKHTLAQQVEFSSTVHRALYELEFVYPAFGLPLTVRENHGDRHGLGILR